MASYTTPRDSIVTAADALPFVQPLEHVSDLADQAEVTGPKTERRWVFYANCGHTIRWRDDLAGGAAVATGRRAKPLPQVEPPVR